MRVPGAAPPRRPLGRRAWLIGAAVVVVLLIATSLRLARVYTDYLWFEEVGFEDTWWGLLGARIIPAVIFSLGCFLLLWVNLAIADRVAPRYRAMGPEDEFVERYRASVEPYSGRIRVGVALFFAIVMGAGVAAEWRSWILFANAVDFGVEDPQFQRDIGFYVFRLPFLRFAVSWAFAALLVVFIVTAVFHYVNGGIRLQSPFQRVTPQVKAHLSVILALMALTKTAQYWLDRFGLLFSHRGVVDGASYTDVKAQLPALELLMWISIGAAALFVANIFRRGWTFPIIAVGLWGFIAIVVGTVYPAYVQRFQVQPNEFEKEEPYIARNIEATRDAFALASVDVREFDYEENLDGGDIEANRLTIDNARLWDPAELQAAYGATQEIRTFYRFDDVDADRYEVGDQVLPAMISARELNEGELPSRTWTNAHLVYTHGYAAVVSAANQVDGDEPSFLLADIPPAGDLEPGETDLYFGEKLAGFSVVDTKVDEVQPAGTDSGEDATTRYEGTGGVPVSNVMRRAALALRFGSWDLFASDQLTGESRVIYNRDVRSRVEAAAPFLHYDSDPYPVLVDGRVLWVLDAYTTTGMYPYSQELRPGALAAGSDLASGFNYVRNSVKATVDAYDGTIRFYVVDDEPIVRAYRKAFPELFRDADEMPEGLREHWRYPEDVFRAQTEQYSTYHMTDPEEFYFKQDLWDVAPRPNLGPIGENLGAAATTSGGNDGGRSSTLESTGIPSDPLYVMLRLPGEERDVEFVLTRQFVPRRKNNQLSAFMVARSDGEQYGKLVAYVTPQNSTAPSPAKAATLIDSDEDISSQFSLLDQRGSKVIRGNVQLLPIGDSIIYMRPIFVEAEGTSTFPRFRFVAMTYGERAVLEESVDEALAALFGTEGPGEEPPDGEEPPPPDGEEPVPDDVEELLSAAEREFASAQAALDANDLGGYQEHIEQAREYVAEAQRLLGEGGGEAPATSAPPTTAAAAGV